MAERLISEGMEPEPVQKIREYQKLLEGDLEPRQRQTVQSLIKQWEKQIGMKETIKKKEEALQRAFSTPKTQTPAERRKRVLDVPRSQSHVIMVEPSEIYEPLSREPSGISTTQESETEEREIPKPKPKPKIRRGRPKKEKEREGYYPTPPPPREALSSSYTYTRSPRPSPSRPLGEELEIEDLPSRLSIPKYEQEEVEISPRPQYYGIERIEKIPTKHIATVIGPNPIEEEIWIRSRTPPSPTTEEEIQREVEEYMRRPRTLEPEPELEEYMMPQYGPKTYLQTYRHPRQVRREPVSKAIRPEPEPELEPEPEPSIEEVLSRIEQEEEKAWTPKGKKGIMEESLKKLGEIVSLLEQKQKRPVTPEEIKKIAKLHPELTLPLVMKLAEQLQSTHMTEGDLEKLKYAIPPKKGYIYRKRK